MTPMNADITVGADMTPVTLPQVQMNVVRPNAPVLGRVVKNEICTASLKAAGFVRHIEFDVSGTPLAGSYRAGQAFGVIPPGLNAKGKPHLVRLYSIACPSGGEDGTGNIVSTTVKRTIDEHWDDQSLFLGVASNYLCNLSVGDEVQLSGPNGKRFILPTNPNDHDYLFIATGTGIAPFRGMVKDLLAGGCQRHITLVMGSPYRTDLLYHDEFLNLQEHHANFTYLTAISRERDDEGRSGMYAHQRIAHERDRILPALSQGETLVYICGIAGMELGVYQTLARTLTGESLGAYLECDRHTLADVDNWSKATLHKQLKTTDRVFVEVY